MTSKFDHISKTVIDLAKKDQHKLARQILLYYYELADTIEDYELIGSIALKYSYPDLAVKTAEHVYSMCFKTEHLFVARSNLIRAYQIANTPEKALTYNQINLELAPDDFDSIVSLAVTLKLSGQILESEKVIDNLRQSNITAEQRNSLYITQAHKMLREGKTAAGIKCFLHSDKDRTTVFDLKGMKRWNGIITPGSKLYVNACGGYGDEFINIRFFDHLRSYGMDPILFSNLERNDLAAVFRRNGYDVITDTDLIETHVPWDYLMDLPITMNLNEKDLWKGEYITPARNRKNYLGSTDKLRIGFKCNGNPHFGQDVYRSIPFEQMLLVIPKEGTEIYYFDIENEKENVNNLKQRIKGWDDTLDFIDQMDLMISSCTSIAHASGSMGKPTAVCTPISEYYIWTSTRTDESTPWYGNNFYVFKQKKIRSWKEPLEKVASVINKLMNDKLSR
jgi:hypothetical protein